MTITEVTAINPGALRVTLCYLAALPKGMRSTKKPSGRSHWHLESKAAEEICSCSVMQQKNETMPMYTTFSWAAFSPAVTEKTIYVQPVGHIRFSMHLQAQKPGEAPSCTCEICCFPVCPTRDRIIIIPQIIFQRLHLPHFLPLGLKADHQDPQSQGIPFTTPSYAE